MANLPSNYVTWDMSAQTDMDSEYDQMQGSYMKLKEGANMFRVLPPHPDSGGVVWLPTWQHYVPGAGPTDKGRMVICPKNQVRDTKQECAICDVMDKLRKGSSQDIEVSKRHNARLSWQCNVLELKVDDDGTVTGRGPLTLSLSNTLKNLIWDSRSKRGIAYRDPVKRGSIVDFTHPITGMNIYVEKVDGPPWWTAIQFYPNEPMSLFDIEGIDAENILETMTNLTKMVVIPSEYDLDEMANVFASASASAPTSARVLSSRTAPAALGKAKTRITDDM